MNLSTLFSSINSSGLLHNAIFLPLFGALLDFITGVSSAIKRNVFTPDQFANIIGKDSELFKYGVGALILLVINGFNHTSLDLNIALAIPGAGLLLVPQIASIWNNLLELLPSQVAPYAQVLAQEVAKDAQSVLPSTATVVTTDNQATVSTPIVTANTPIPDQLTQSVPAFKMPTL